MFERILAHIGGEVSPKRPFRARRKSITPFWTRGFSGFPCRQYLCSRRFSRFSQLCRSRGNWASCRILTNQRRPCRVSNLGRARLSRASEGGLGGSTSRPTIIVFVLKRWLFCYEPALPLMGDGRAAVVSGQYW